ncbi:MAG: response regulator transcription factor [Lachnospiraceae bacterium]|nr:response regulator transcription factor [Lachnospiraceae bacterium]
MRIAITDDLREDRSRLETMLRENLTAMGYQPECLDCYESGEKLLEAFEPNRYDFICLDIYMDGITGIETANVIRQKDKNVRLVFVSSSNDFAMESYRVKADYYLLKPYTADDIRRMIQEIGPEQIEGGRVLTLPDGSTCMLSDIVFTEYSNHKVTIHFRDGHVHSVWTSQAEMEQLLCSRECFATSTKGIIVNLEQIAVIDETDVRMLNGILVPVSRARRAELKQLHAETIFRNLRKAGRH